MCADLRFCVIHVQSQIIAHRHGVLIVHRCDDLRRLGLLLLDAQAGIALDVRDDLGAGVVHCCERRRCFGGLLLHGELGIGAQLPEVGLQPGLLGLYRQRGRVLLVLIGQAGIGLDVGNQF
jgi:hypothetical protein